MYFLILTRSNIISLTHKSLMALTTQNTKFILMETVIPDVIYIEVLLHKESSRN